MRMILLAGVALLSACGGGGDETNTTDMNTMATDNMMMDQNMMMDPNMMMDANGAIDANMAGGAAGTDAATANLMAQDAASNDADTNLANGL